MLNPAVPQDAQAIVAAYLRLVEAHAAAEVYPCCVRDLPYSKDTIRRAFHTSVRAIAAKRQLTPDMRDYLEVAYVSLADYVDEASVRLLREYTRAGEELAAAGPIGRDRTSTEAWLRLSEQSRLAGEIARMISVEAEHLRAEFRSWQVEPDA